MAEASAHSPLAPPAPVSAQLLASRARELRAAQVRLGSRLRVSVAEGSLFEVGLRLAEDGSGLRLDDRWVAAGAISRAWPGWPSAGGTEPFHPTLCLELRAHGNPIRLLCASSAEALRWLAALHESPQLAIPSSHRRTYAQLAFARLRLMWERALRRQDEEALALSPAEVGASPLAHQRGGLLRSELRGVVAAADTADERALRSRAGGDSQSHRHGGLGSQQRNGDDVEQGLSYGRPPGYGSDFAQY